MVEILVAIKALSLLVRPRAIDPIGMLLMENSSTIWRDVTAVWHPTSQRRLTNWTREELHGFRKCSNCDDLVVLSSPESAYGHTHYLCFLCTFVFADQDASPADLTGLVNNGPDCVHVLGQGPARIAKDLEKLDKCSLVMMRLVSLFTNYNNQVAFDLFDAGQGDELKDTSYDGTFHGMGPARDGPGRNENNELAEKIIDLRLRRAEYGVRLWGNHYHILGGSESRVPLGDPRTRLDRNRNVPHLKDVNDWVPKNDETLPEGTVHSKLRNMEMGSTVVQEEPDDWGSVA